MSIILEFYYSRDLVIKKDQIQGIIDALRNAVSKNSANFKEVYKKADDFFHLLSSVNFILKINF